MKESGLTNPLSHRLKSDYFRIEISVDICSVFFLKALKSDYFRIEMIAAMNGESIEMYVKIRLF
ncbi:hypothetical protein MBMB1_0360 [Methanobacterium sp. MB1]|nr:hypothetical protein MBMB1_0360 [Methanobacterium sp. MB1]